MPNRQNPLGTKPIGKLIFSYAVPGIVSMVVNALYNIVDQIFIGHNVGYLGNAATTVTFPLIVAGLAVSLLFGAGCSAFISLKLGEKKPGEAEKALGNMIVSLSTVSIIFSVTALIFLEPVLKVLGATDKFLPLAYDYASIILLGQPAVVVTTGLTNAVRADGSPRFSMTAMLIGAAINTALDPVFIIVLGMGVKGAAVATVISQVISLVITASYFVNRTKNIHFHFRNLRPDFRLIGNIATLGLSSFLTQISAMLLQIVMNNMLRFYGEQSVYGAEIAISGMGIVMKLSGIMISVMVGISIGSQPIFGYNYGAKNYGRVRKTYLTSITFATSLSLIFWLIFMIFPEALVSIFGDSTPLFVEYCTMCFRLFMAFSFIAGFQIISSNYFQAVGHPSKAIVLSLNRQVFFLIPLMIILGLIFGLRGVLSAGAAADFLASCVTSIFIIKEMKRLKKIDAAA